MQSVAVIYLVNLQHELQQEKDKGNVRLLQGIHHNIFLGFGPSIPSNRGIS